MRSRHSSPLAQVKSIRLAAVGLLAILSSIAYALVAKLSAQFAYELPIAERPILTVVALFCLVFAFYLLAVMVVFRSSASRFMLMVIIGASLAFRAIMLFSTPILEVDIYRYLWDGTVTLDGVNPYQFTPEQVQHAAEDDVLGNDLDRLRDLKSDDPITELVIKRIHFGFLPSIYPPTSQLVFAGATALMPPAASIEQRIVIMKACMVFFDVLTLFVVVALLRLTRLALSLCVLYGWCPLLIKEFANSGHLDSIAIFLVSLSVYLVARAGQASGGWRAARLKSGLLAIASMVTLALAVGAKLYPIILVPLLISRIIQQSRSWLAAVAPSTCFLFTACVVLAPMMLFDHSRQTSLLVDDSGSDERMTTPVASTDALEVFLREWEMNDFLFLILFENLKPDLQLTTNSRAWFVMTTDDFRTSVADWGSQILSVPTPQVPFALARLLTLLASVGVGVWLVRKTWSDTTLVCWLRAIFLTLAWFWLLCPTQNPWYWAWGIPFLAFARARSWILVSGLLFAYYLRFWFDQHWMESTVWMTPYRGAGFFDLVVTWIEFGPWFVLLAVETWYNRRCESQTTAIS